MQFVFRTKMLFICKAVSVDFNNSSLRQADSYLLYRAVQLNLSTRVLLYNQFLLDDLELQNPLYVPVFLSHRVLLEDHKVLKHHKDLKVH
jgi:hypothetical protein